MKRVDRCLAPQLWRAAGARPHVATPLSRVGPPPSPAAWRQPRPALAARADHVPARRSFAQAAESEAAKAKAEETSTSTDEAGAEEPSTVADDKADDKASAAEPAAEAQDATTPEAPAEGPEAALRREAAELQEKLRSKKHDLLLALADFENNKKRCTKERESRRRGATVHFAKRMVGVYADFELLATPVNADAESSSSGACEALREGVVLTRDLYRSTLERFNVEPFSAELGSPFVAARHESVGAAEDSPHPANTVAEAVRPGWLLEPRGAAPAVLQRAQVKVAQHGPAAPPPPPE
mmetsp:Transcript_880/g.2625  ORF Transcript_880/g.2625 Transcript_880/m.2625 type:complete len:297 (-) Transcript_880:33-923(-)